jgi:probable FeS assembly SUF system protein SufT
MHVHEQIQLTRDCLAVAVPGGDKVLLPRGVEVGLVQAMGSSFTVKARGRLFRIDAAHADALNKEPPPRPELPENASDAEVEQLIWDQMRGCYDPEIPINIVDLGLIYRCDIERNAHGGRRVLVDMTLTAPGCGMGNVLAQDVWERIMEVPTVEEAQVEVVFSPPWNASRMTEEARLQTGMF